MRPMFLSSMQRFKLWVVNVLNTFPNLIRLSLDKDRRKNIALMEETLAKQQSVQLEMDEKQTTLLEEVEIGNVSETLLC